MKELILIATLCGATAFYSYSQIKSENKGNNTSETVKYNWCPDGIHTYKKSKDECPPVKTKPDSNFGYVQCWDGSWVTNIYACPPQNQSSKVKEHFGNPFYSNEELNNKFGTAIQTDYDSIGTFQGCKTICVIHQTDLITKEKNSFVDIVFKDCFFNGSYWEYPTSTKDNQGISVKHFLLDNSEIHNLIKLLTLLQKKEFDVTWQADGMHTKPMNISFKTRSGLNLYAIKPMDKKELDMFFLFLDEPFKLKKVQTLSNYGLYWDGKDFMPDFVPNKKTTEVKFLCSGGFLPDWDGNCPTCNLLSDDLNDLLRLLIISKSKF